MLFLKFGRLTTRSSVFFFFAKLVGTLITIFSSKDPKNNMNKRHTLFYTLIAIKFNIVTTIVWQIIVNKA